MSKTLVIGYGNSLRGDDGVGVRAVEIIAHKHPGIDCLTLTELTPDLAETLSRYDNVLFVDASITASDLKWRTVSPQLESGGVRTHALTPEALIGIAITLYDRCPEVITIVEIPARSFHYSEKLSPLTQSMLFKFVSLFDERPDTMVENLSSAAEWDQSPSTIPQFLQTSLIPS